MSINRDPAKNLPLEMHFAVLSHLSAETLCRSASVSKSWHLFSENGILWKALLRKDFPLYAIQDTPSYKEQYRQEYERQLRLFPKDFQEAFGGSESFRKIPSSSSKRAARSYSLTKVLDNHPKVIINLKRRSTGSQEQWLVAPSRSNPALCLTRESGLPRECTKKIACTELKETVERVITHQDKDLDLAEAQK